MAKTQKPNHNTEPETTMTKNQNTPSSHRDEAPDSGEWIQIKKAAKLAEKCERTLRRAIKAGKLTGRKADSGRNSPMEVERTSLETWMTASKSSSPQKDKENDCSEPKAETDPKPKSEKKSDEGEGVGGDKKKRNSKNPVPKEVRLLRRWKNYMRCANQEQMLSMICWLSSRLKRPATSSKQ